MKKILYSIVFIIVFLMCSSYHFAYSAEFTFLIETMEVPKENILGQLINEDIYNLFRS